MPHELISLMSSPTLPVAFSSRMRGGAPRGRLLVSEEYYVVFEHRPLTVLQMTKAAMEKTIPEVPIHYLYVASVFYRKSRNPHGPSARPIFAFCLEYTEFTCAMKPQGFWAKLIGSAKEPAEVFSAVFYARGRANMGTIPNNFTDKTAQDFLLGEVCERLTLPRGTFRDVGPLTLGADCPAIA
jgi:hypothetical protein